MKTQKTVAGWEYIEVLIAMLLMLGSLFLPLVSMAESELDSLDAELLAEESSETVELEDLEDDFEDEEEDEALLASELGEDDTASASAEPVLGDGGQSSVDAELLQSLESAKPRELIPQSRRTAQTDDSAGGPVDTSKPNSIADVQFKSVDTGSRITLEFLNKPAYKQIRNQDLKQVVFIFENTKTPSQFQRAFDTTEFVSVVALFTVLEMPGSSPPRSKLIVQLRENKQPKVRVTKSGLTVDFPTPDFVPPIDTVKAKATKPFEGEEDIYDPALEFKGELIERLEIKNSSVADVLRLVARTSGYNIVIGDDVTGTVGTLSLRNVPWDQVFAMILQSKQLGYVKKGNVLRIGTLASLKAEKDAAIANMQSRMQVEPLRTVLIPASYAQASDLLARARPLLSDRGTLESDSRTNTVIVKDITQVINRIQKLIKALDTQPPRVSVSARIVEVLQEFSRGLGFSTVTANDAISGLNLNAGFGSDFTVSGGSVSISAPTFSNLSAAFRVGETENKVRVLANPVVTAMNNETATVTQSISFFSPEQVVVSGVPITQFKQITASLNLTVRPIVAGDGSVSMSVSVQNEIPRTQGNQTIVDTRTINTQVLVENGDTAVIGGVFGNTINTARAGIPFLMNLPIVGFFVSNKSFSETRNEILMFLTPKILNAEAAFKRTL